MAAMTYEEWRAGHRYNMLDQRYDVLRSAWNAGRAQGLEDAARVIDQTWQKTPAEYASAIRALAATKPESAP